MSWLSTRLDKTPRQNLQLTACAMAPHVPGRVWLPWLSLLFLAGFWPCCRAPGCVLLQPPCSVVWRVPHTWPAKARCVAFGLGTPNPFSTTLHYSSSNAAAKTQLTRVWSPTPHEHSFVACRVGRARVLCTVHCLALCSPCTTFSFVCPAHAADPAIALPFAPFQTQRVLVRQLALCERDDDARSARRCLAQSVAVRAEASVVGVFVCGASVLSERRRSVHAALCCCEVLLQQLPLHLETVTCVHAIVPMPLPLSGFISCGCLEDRCAGNSAARSALRVWVSPRSQLQPL